MKIRLRPVEHVNHLRKIRGRALTTSVARRSHAETFERFRPELSHLIVHNKDLLKVEDSIVALALKDFPANKPEDGKISKELAKELNRAMDLLEKIGSPELVSTVKAVRVDLGPLVGKPLKAALEKSNTLSGL